MPPPLDGVRVMLDGERYVEMINPIPTEATTLKMKSRTIGVHKRGSGASVEMESFIYDGETGKEYYRLTSGSFLVGATGFLDSGTTNSEKIVPPSRAPDAVEEMVTSPYQTQIYRLSGDYNPLHVDPASATAMGFKEPILHGLCSLGFSTRAVLKRFAENDPTQFKSVKLRFSKPVIPGQTLLVEMWDMGSGRIVFQTKVKETGKVSVNNAYVQLQGTAAQPKAKL
jgi:3-hydroxyacyl-CoA dehydrogenase/3a,7a,12a-trihydroxy-5b-cholest-24-enoyl-CoA hydratase